MTLRNKVKTKVWHNAHEQQIQQYATIVFYFRCLKVSLWGYFITFECHFEVDKNSEAMPNHFLSGRSSTEFQLEKCLFWHQKLI